MCDRKGLQTNSTTSPVIFIPFLTKCYLLIQIPRILTSLFSFPSLQAWWRKWFLSRTQRGHIYMAPHGVTRKSCCREFSRKANGLPVLSLFFWKSLPSFSTGLLPELPLLWLWQYRSLCFSVSEHGRLQDLILLCALLPYMKWFWCCLLLICALQTL